MKIVFLHWLGQNEESWREVISCCTIDAEFFSPNLFDLCEKNKTFHEMYRWLEKYLQQFNEPVFLCGLSLGGILALRYAIHHNEKVRGLIVVGAKVEFSRFLIFLQNIIFRLLPERIFIKIGISKQDIITLCHSLTQIDIVGDVVKISCPVWVFVWEKDFINKKDSLAIAHNVQNAQYMIIENSGHEVNVQNPRLLARKIEYFIRSTCI